MIETGYATSTAFFPTQTFKTYFYPRESLMIPASHCNQNQPSQFIRTGCLAINQVNNFLKNLMTGMDFGLTP